jgi:hypothetical protein
LENSQPVRWPCWPLLFVKADGRTSRSGYPPLFGGIKICDSMISLIDIEPGMSAAARRPSDPAPLAIPPEARAATINDSRPLLCVESAALALGSDSEYVENQVASLKLVSFNIATPGAQRRLLRLWTVSVFALKSGVQFRVKLSAKSLASAVIPPGRATWPLARIAWLFHCSPEHVAHLIRSGAIKEAPRGPRDFRNVVGASVVSFLTERRES